MTTDAKPQKSTIYLDAEDEITAIIEKVKSAHSNIVAVVPPKRAAALQSVVNLKLLQRAARTSKKNLVLVTSEPSLLPLAGTVGMMVAKTTSSKPEVPPAPSDGAAPMDNDDEVVESGEEPELDPQKSVGELAEPAATTAADEVETVELEDAKPAVAAKSGKKKSKSDKPDKKLKVPNFNTFRKKLILAGCGLVVLILLWVLANMVLPSAKIIIKTDTSNTDINLNITGTATATNVDTDNLVVPIVKQEYKKTDDEKVAATGKRDDGTKASGTMTVTNCIDDGQSHTVPSGTIFSSDGKSFATESSVTLSPALFSAGNCMSNALGLSQTVNVTATENGDSYNLSSRSYQSPITGINATGSDMSGGTSKIVKIVSQSDIDGAKQKILDRIKTEGETEIKSQLEQQGALPLKDTLKAGDPAVTASPSVNQEGDNVTVTVVVTYTQVGVKRDDINKIIEAQVNRQIDTSKQQVQNTGLDSAVFKVTTNTDSTVKFQIQTVAQAGPQLDIEGIKKEIVGKKRGETTSIITARPGIKDVEIDYSPFWVFSTPSRTNKISITFESANASQ